MKRKRLIHREASDSNFTAKIAKDPWKNQLMNTKSLRSMKSLQASLDCLKKPPFNSTTNISMKPAGINVLFTLPKIA